MDDPLLLVGVGGVELNECVCVSVSECVRVRAASDTSHLGWLSE